MDERVLYTGPKAEFATLTGSPLWGLSVDDVTVAAKKHGWKHIRDFRPETPYGMGPLVQHFITGVGRNVIRIPSYGGVSGEDWRFHQTTEKVFWILWRAGVKVLLVGGTSGIADWKTDDDKIEPGDLVLPWSYFTDTHDHRGLPGSEYETVWPKHDLLLDDPFCPCLAGYLEAKFSGYVNSGLIRRMHTTKDRRVALVVPYGITYETSFDILVWLALSKTISDMDPKQPSVATLHGDCINPVLARLLGIHLAYYHMVANVAQGLPAKEGITESLYRLYLSNFPEVALQAEFEILEEMPIPDEKMCSCISGLHTAPEVFSEAMTQTSE